MEFSNQTEQFLKVGITKRNIHSRFATRIPYKTKLVKEYSMLLYDAWQIEESIKQTFKIKQYVPMQHFGGSTECYTYGAFNEIIKHLEGLKDEKRTN